MSILKILRSSYEHVYFNHSAKQKKTDLDDSALILQFFALPSGTDARAKKILGKLAGWNKNYSASLNVFLAIFILPFNIVLTLLKLTLNVLKLVTELLPNFLVKATENARENLAVKVTNPKTSLKVIILCTIAFLLLGFSNLSLRLLYFVGCATTSPADTMRSAFAWGNYVGNEYLGKTFGKAFGAFCALVSMFTTACVYAVLFPLAIKLLITQVPMALPAIANWIGNVIGAISGSAQVAASVTAFFTTVLPAFLSTFGQMVMSALALSLSQVGFTSLPALAVLVSMLIATVITPLVAVIDAIKGDYEPKSNLLVQGVEDKTTYYNQQGQTQQQDQQPRAQQDNPPPQLSSVIFAGAQLKPAKVYGEGDGDGVSKEGCFKSCFDYFKKIR